VFINKHLLMHYLPYPFNTLSPSLTLLVLVFHHPYLFELLGPFHSLMS